MIEAIVLAAGLSRRMGKSNKLILPLKGKPTLLHTIESLLASKVDRIIVVTGHEHKKIEKLLEGYTVEIIYNEYYKKGQLSSIQKGLSVLSKTSTAFMICLSDMPLMTLKDYNVLITTYQKYYPKKVIVLPEKNGRKGNPKIFHPSFGSNILLLTSDLYQGAKAIVQQNKHHTIVHSTSSENFFTDMDNLEDYERLKNSL